MHILSAVWTARDTSSYMVTIFESFLRFAFSFLSNRFRSALFIYSVIIFQFYFCFPTRSRPAPGPLSVGRRRAVLVERDDHSAERRENSSKAPKRESGGNSKLRSSSSPLFSRRRRGGRLWASIGRSDNAVQSVCRASLVVVDVVVVVIIIVLIAVRCAPSSDLTPIPSDSSALWFNWWFE